MKFNWRKFCITFSFLYLLFLTATISSGCAAAWLGAISALLPALEGAVSAAIAFVAALEGKTVSASVIAAIKKVGDDVAGEIANVQQLIAAANNTATPTLIGQIQAVLQAILDNLNGILTSASITDSSTVNKFTSLIGLAIAAAQAIVGFIPAIQAKLKAGLSNEELQAEDKVASDHVKVLEKALKDGYVMVVTTPTANADVNAALASLPQSL